MRIRTCLLLLAGALGGCAGGGDVAGVSESTLAVASTLPACAATAAPARYAVEDVDATRLIVRVDGAALCAGSLDDLAQWDLRRTPDLPDVHKAGSDPMPADGKHPADSDPMPAQGDHPGASDPMPAGGKRPTSANTGNAPIAI